MMTRYEYLSIVLIHGDAKRAAQLSDHDAEQREIIAQQAAELTGWRTVAMGVGAIDEHALSLHLDEQAQRIKELEDKLAEYERTIKGKNEETIESVSKWADGTFGPSTPRTALTRALQEIEELTSLAHNNAELLVEEAADVCITLYRYISLVDKEAINKKMAINRVRKWKFTGKGVGQHYDERESNP